jgi:hypothetical protein
MFYYMNPEVNAALLVELLIFGGFFVVSDGD